MTVWAPFVVEIDTAYGVAEVSYDCDGHWSLRYTSAAEEFRTFTLDAGDPLDWRTAHDEALAHLQTQGVV